MANSDIKIKVNLVYERKDKTMDYKEALKAAIDGEKIRPISAIYRCYYVCWDNNEKQFTIVYPSGNKEKAHGILDNTDWEIIRPEPKFKIGEFVVDCDNDYMRIVDCEYISGTYRYCLSSTSKNYKKEDCYYVQNEEELKEVK